jgi:hypothetical protein
MVDKTLHPGSGHTGNIRLPAEGFLLSYALEPALLWLNFSFALSEACPMHLHD